MSQVRVLPGEPTFSRISIPLWHLGRLDHLRNSLWGSLLRIERVDVVSPALREPRGHLTNRGAGTFTECEPEALPSGPAGNRNDLSRRTSHALRGKNNTDGCGRHQHASRDARLDQRLDAPPCTS